MGVQVQGWPRFKAAMPRKLPKGPFICLLALCPCHVLPNLCIIHFQKKLSALPANVCQMQEDMKRRLCHACLFAFLHAQAVDELTPCGAWGCFSIFESPRDHASLKHLSEKTLNHGKFVSRVCTCRFRIFWQPRGLESTTKRMDQDKNDKELLRTAGIKTAKLVESWQCQYRLRHCEFC